MPQVTEQLALTFNGSTDDGAQLACPQAHQLAVQNGDLSLEAGRKLIFPGDAPLSVTGDLIVTTGSSPQERLRVGANGIVSIHGNLTVTGLINGSDVAAERQKVATLQQQVSDLQTVVPIGTIILFGSDTPPAGWLRCDGAILQKSQYPKLAQVLGSRYGGDGTNTFGLPKLVGRFPVGAGGGHAAGTSGGSETCTLSVANVPSHVHSGTTTPANKANFRIVHTAGPSIFANHVNGWTGGPNFHDVTQTDVPGGIHTHNFETDGGHGCAGQAFSVMPPFLALHYLIKAA